MKANCNYSFLKDYTVVMSASVNTNADTTALLIQNQLSDNGNDISRSTHLLVFEVYLVQTFVSTWWSPCQQVDWRFCLQVFNSFLWMTQTYCTQDLLNKCWESLISFSHNLVNNKYWKQSGKLIISNIIRNGNNNCSQAPVGLGRHVSALQQGRHWC